MATKRHFTQAQTDAAARLLRLWLAKKDELALTQEKVAQLCEWSGNAAFSHYLNGKVPLNTDAVLKLAKVMRVHPTEIMPEIAELLPEGAAQAGKDGGDTEAAELARLIQSLPASQRAALSVLAKAAAGEDVEQAAAG